MVKTSVPTRTGREVHDGDLVIPLRARQTLQAAMMQMDLLLETRQVDQALLHMVALLKHMKAMKAYLP